MAADPGKELAIAGFTYEQTVEQLGVPYAIYRADAMPDTTIRFSAPGVRDAHGQTDFRAYVEAVANQVAETGSLPLSRTDLIRDTLEMESHRESYVFASGDASPGLVVKQFNIVGAHVQFPFMDFTQRKLAQHEPEYADFKTIAPEQYALVMRHGIGTIIMQFVDGEPLGRMITETSSQYPSADPQLHNTLLRIDGYACAEIELALGDIAWRLCYDLGRNGHNLQVAGTIDPTFSDTSNLVVAMLDQPMVLTPQHVAAGAKGIAELEASSRDS